MSWVRPFRSPFVFWHRFVKWVENLDNSTIGEEGEGTRNILFTGVAIEKRRQINVELRS